MSGSAPAIGAPTGRAARAPIGARAARITALALVAILCALVLALTYRGGGYVPSSWLPLVVVTAALALLLAASGPGLVTGRFQRIILVLFAAQVVWTFASLLWAGSRANAWEEANRTLFYALAIALVFAAMRWGGPTILTWLPVFLMAAISLAAVATLVMLSISSEPSRFLPGGRLSYPVTYANGLAAFFMIGCWLALGLANATRRRSAVADTLQERRHELRAHRFRWWTQPLFLGIATFLIELALLTQSRGGLWTLFMVVPLFLIFSPHRLRALVNLVIVAVPLALLWGRWNAVYSAMAANQPVRPALDGTLRAIAYSVIIVLILWALTWLIERRIGVLPGRLGQWIGVGLIVLLILGFVGGVVYVDQRTGGLAAQVQKRWDEFVSDKVGADTGSRFGAFGLNGRLGVWKVAGRAFEEDPVLGLGAQNFEIYYFEHRTTTLDMRQPHSQPLQVLSELGFPGLVLYMGFMVFVLVRAGMLRFGAAGRRAGRSNQALVAAMMTAVLSWFIHSSADWLWQLAAVTLPAVMLLGGLAGLDATHLVHPRRRRSRTPAVPLAVAVAAGAGVQTALGAGDVASAPIAEGARVPDEAASSDLTDMRNSAYLEGSRADGHQSGPDALAGTWARIAPRLVRPLAVVLAILAIVSAALPYLSSRYSDSASAAIATAPQNALARADTAAGLDPTSTAPFAVRAGVHAAAAAQAAPGSAGRALELMLAAQAWEEATQVEPQGWLYHYQAAQAYLAARDAAALAGGVQAGSAGDLEGLAGAHLAEARRLNPLSSAVAALEKKL